MPVPLVKLTAVHVLGLAAFGIVMGDWLKRRIPWLEAVHIPTPIAGGLIYSLLILALRDRIVNFQPDMALQSILMVAFFTTIGFSASLRLIREGGFAVAVLLVLASVGAALQNALGIGLAKLLGLNPLLGIIAGATALAGGPATTIAFGKTFEDMGLPAATTAGLAAAMFGIIAAGLVSGPLGGLLIRRHKLTAVTDGAQPGRKPILEPLDAAKLMTHVVAIGIAMAAGSVISTWLRDAGVVLPGYIGAMVVAAAFRNIDDRTGWLRLSQAHTSAIGTIALYLFIVMALIALEIWQLTALAVPVITILAAQTVMTLAFCYWVPMRVLGRNYEAAVMAGGFCGFMLGITANAVASMDEITRKHGAAPRAFLAVPVTGAFLIDFTNALLITAMANLVVSR
jgi:ESS family glutamate:Na+ symporter